ncbi:MAG: type II toxin-antitoxin system RelE/ParE family toxin [Cyanobacteriota bacterium]|nr:type II toxin-antitoxin system RelE/ParE family toxin [Cyanobacteriota bacterium]
MNQYIISPAAISDLEEIINYFATRNVDAGDRDLEAFFEEN